MSWRQASTSKQNERESSSLKEIIKIKTELSTYRIEVQFILLKASLKDEEISQLKAQIEHLKNEEQKHKNQIIKIGTLLNCSNIDEATDIGSMITILELQACENVKKVQEVENKLLKASEVDENECLNLQRKEKQLALRDEEIKILTQKLNAAELSFTNLQKESEHQNYKNKELLDRIESLQNYHKELELQAKIENSNSFLHYAEEAKKSCEELLMQIHVQEDDFLRTYLHKSHNFKNVSSGISNHNKYGFIFREG